ncbi:hypothetical protein [Streptomyces sp. NPDC003077]|uniref:hypothetical protein n=1 Tax=Streptomyces sp. NPDC003077 TaxID=3154443 RepID=UPI0033A819E5
MLRKEPTADLSAVFSQLLDAQLGQEAYERGDFADAVACFARAATTRRHPKEVPLMYLLLARSHLRLRDRVRARAALDRAARCEPALDPWYLSAGVFHAALDAGKEGDTAASWLGYTMLRELDHPDFRYTAVNNLGALHYRHGRKTEAREHWEQVMAEGDANDQAIAAHNLGCYWADHGDRLQAARYEGIAAQRRRAVAVRRVLSPKQWLRRGRSCLRRWRRRLRR